jgi:hypothetical protein
MLPEEIMEHVHEESVRYFMAVGNDCSYAEAVALADKTLARSLAAHLCHAMICMAHVEHMFCERVKDRAIKQLYNWG